jgi:hypothetical protein
MSRWRAVSLNDKSYKLFLSHIVLIQFVMVVNASESCQIPENAVTRWSHVWGFFILSPGKNILIFITGSTMVRQMDSGTPRNLEYWCL